LNFSLQFFAKVQRFKPTQAATVVRHSFTLKVDEALMMFEKNFV